MTSRLFVSLSIVVVLAQSLGTAGGPLQVEQGAPVLWNVAQPIAYWIDGGPLGQFPEPVPQRFASDAFDTWAKVPTASLTLSAARLPEDVRTAARYIALEKDRRRGSVVVFDNVGDIVRGIYGKGNEKHILGFATPRLSGQHFTRFTALMNGFLARDAATVRSTMVHEFGHALGLDHAQINVPFAGNGNTNDDQYLPTMYPTSTDDDATLIDLNPDDEAAVSRLYPNAAFARSFGTIRGRLVRADGRPVLGANVVASALVGGTEDPMQRYACVSDYLMHADGTFEIIVRPGTYRLGAEAVLPKFGGGSSVGPYAEKSSGESFRNPIRPTTFPGTHVVTAGAVLDLGVLTAR